MDQHCYHRRVVMSHTAANIAASSTLAHSSARSTRLKKDMQIRDDPSTCWCHGCSATPHLYHGVIWNESAQEYEAQIPRDGGVLTSVGFRTTAVAAAKLYDVEMRKVHNETAQYKLNFPFTALLIPCERCGTTRQRHPLTWRSVGVTAVSTTSQHKGAGRIIKGITMPLLCRTARKRRTGSTT